ncbi:hypothetical protein HBI23_119810 [Parastagonospora nodorum]|nr:hypothetical protein HBI23_119810 [Parastagonospora nodorum]
MVKNTRNQQVRGGVVLPPVKRARPLKTILQSNLQDSATSTWSQTYEPRRYASSNKGTPAPLPRMKTISRYKPKQNTAVILLSQLLTNDRTTLCGTPKTAPLLVCSSIATTPCRKVTAAYALNYLELRPALPRFLNSAIAAIIARAANMMALVGTVLYNAIKEYHDDGTRKTIYFHGYTVEDNYNAICEKWKRLSEIRHDYHDNDCRTGHSNEEDIEANEREEETRVRLRESLGEIHDILLREFRGANDFTESMTHNDDEQELEPEDCDALVERYEEEINCSNLYSTV